MYDFKSCYVFDPDDTSGDQRPPKRRKTKRTSQPSSATGGLSFVPLLRGAESIQNLQNRSRIFEGLWGHYQGIINNILEDLDSSLIESVASFIKNHDLEKPSGKLPTVILLVGPQYGIPASLYEIIARRVGAQERTISVHLDSGQSPNLKAILKHINQHGTSQVLTSDDYNQLHQGKGGQKLSYDLEILYTHVRTNSIGRVILFLQDSEAFECRLLAELIDLLSSWHDRIPFVLLFSVATSLELLEAKFPRGALKCLSGKHFEVKNVDQEKIFQAIHSTLPLSKKSLSESRNVDFLPQPRIWLGSMLSRAVMERQKDYILSPSAFLQAFKYSLMAHFFSNPLSILSGLDVEGWQPEHSEAARDLVSFRRFVHDLLDKQEYSTVKALLDDDEYLERFLKTRIRTSRQSLEAIVSAVDLLFSILSKLPKMKMYWSELYIKAISGELAKSSLLADALLSVKKLPSQLMVDLLGDISRIYDLPEDLKLCMTELDQLINECSPDGSMSLKSSYDIQHSNLRTTVVAHKVELSKHAARMTSHETAYTNIVDRVQGTLDKHLEAILIDPQDIVLHELLIYDLKAPYSDAFSPKPRFALERALSSPRDYLACDCCDSAEVGLSASHPATCILYQLYLESGNQINATDLWSAFLAIVGVDEAKDEDEQQQKILTLFSRALAELKYLGLIKGSKKKAEHLSKLLWKGI